MGCACRNCSACSLLRPTRAPFRPSPPVTQWTICPATPVRAGLDSIAVEARLSGLASNMAELGNGHAAPVGCASAFVGTDVTMQRQAGWFELGGGGACCLPQLKRTVAPSCIAADHTAVRYACLPAELAALTLTALAACRQGCPPDFPPPACPPPSRPLACDPSKRPGLSYSTLPVLLQDAAGRNWQQRTGSGDC